MLWYVTHRSKDVGFEHRGEKVSPHTKALGAVREEMAQESKGACACLRQKGADEKVRLSSVRYSGMQLPASIRPVYSNDGTCVNWLVLTGVSRPMLEVLSNHFS